MRLRIAHLLYRLAFKIDPTEPMVWSSSRPVSLEYVDLDLEHWDEVTVRRLRT